MYAILQLGYVFLFRDFSTLMVGRSLVTITYYYHSQPVVLKKENPCGTIGSSIFKHFKCSLNIFHMMCCNVSYQLHLS